LSGHWFLRREYAACAGHAGVPFGTAPVFCHFPYLHLALAVFFVVLFIFFAVRISSAAEKILNKKDPGSIVIDEIAGMLVTLIGLPFNFKTVVLGFILFRTFDILKPFPIRYLEKRVSGGVGVVR
jgi:phosphatidylglycerophosphatase A